MAKNQVNKDAKDKVENPPEEKKAPKKKGAFSPALQRLKRRMN